MQFTSAPALARMVPSETRSFSRRASNTDPFFTLLVESLGGGADGNHRAGRQREFPRLHVFELAAQAGILLGRAG